MQALPTLNTLLARLDPAAVSAERPLARVQLIAWLRPGRHEGAEMAVLRLQQLLQRLDDEPALRERVQALLALLWSESDGGSLLAEYGLARRLSLLRELRRRAALRWLPGTPDTDQLGALFELAFRPADAAWLAALDKPLQGRLVELLAFPARAQALDALALLANEAAAEGQDLELRGRMDPALRQAQPFRQLPLTVAQLAQALEQGSEAEALQHAAYLRALVDACRRAAASVLAHLESHGVSIDLVFTLDQLDGRLERLEALLDLALGGPALPLLLRLIELGGAQRGIRPLLGQHFQLLARQIAERSAETGEHYITRSRAEYFDMLRRAAGGGLVIAGTTVLKFALAALALSPFWGGFAAGLNYALSFVLVMLLHWTVATKQPAMTAPALADSLTALRGLRDEAEVTQAVEGFVDRVAALIRSQVAGIVGNVAVCGPLVLGLPLLLQGLGQAPVIDAAKARYVLNSLSLLGPSLLFAAFTGVLLFGSSLIAGWAENAFVLHRLDSALRWNPRLQALLGPERAQRWARWWRANISGLAANISLGFLLGLVPVVLGFFGLGLDVRHVTLSTGQLAAALGTLGAGLLREPAFWSCVVTVAGIGALNVGVSFWLAFRVALRSRGIRLHERRRIAQALRARLRRAPLSFVLPPRAQASTTSSGDR